jgi:addiction module HigA family antidote
MPPALAAARPQRPPTHPGALLREDVLPALGLTVTDAARHLRITRQQLHRILAEEAGISPEMALRLGKFCGNGPDLWIGMQEAYDLWQARQRIGHEVDAIPTMTPAPRD